MEVPRYEAVIRIAKSIEATRRLLSEAGIPLHELENLQIAEENVKLALLYAFLDPYTMKSAFRSGLRIPIPCLKKMDVGGI
jgi:hypothetical protein